jgi:hypothetical protein
MPPKDSLESTPEPQVKLCPQGLDGFEIVNRARPSARDGAAERLFAQSLTPGLAVVLDFSRNDQIGPIRTGGVQ